MPYPSHPSPRRLRTVAASIAAVLSLVVGAAPAGAAEYRVFSCHTPAGKVASTADWRPITSLDAPRPAATDCAASGLMYTTIGPYQRAAGASTGFTISMPFGLSLRRLSANRWVKLLPGADNGASVQYQFNGGWPSQEGCRVSAGCGGWGWDSPAGDPSAVMEHHFPQGVTWATFQLACNGEPWGACGASDNGRGHLRINAIDMTIDDSSAPVIADVAGSITEAGARSGTETLVYNASDEGAGVYHAILKIDGVEISRIKPDARASCADAGAIADYDTEFDRLQPCAESIPTSIAIDTTRLPDGPHRLESFVRDAAGNHSLAVTRSFVVDNVPPPSVAIRPTITGPALAAGLRPGDSIAAQNGTWIGEGIAFTQRWQRSTATGGWIDIANGSGGTYRVTKDDIDSQLRVIVTATNREGTTDAISEPTGKVTSGATAVVAGVPTPTVGPVGAPAPAGGPAGNGGGGNPATGQLVVDREQRTVDVKHSAKVVITGRLVDADGNPIADATVDVFEQIAITAAPWTKVDTVRTDSQGGYVYRPKTTSSRRLRFAFAEKREGADYRATREVFVSVTAGMTIKAKQKTVPRRGLIRLHGKVVVDQLPAAGAWVEVQVLDASVWRTVATRRVSAGGSWTFKHRLRGASTTRFTFRARLRVAGNIASAEAKSASLKVRVR